MVVHSDEIVTGRVIQVLKCCRPAKSIAIRRRLLFRSQEEEPGIRMNSAKTKSHNYPFTQVCHLRVKRMIGVFFSTHQKTINMWLSLPHDSGCWKKNIGCPGQEGGDAAAISLTALATVSPEAPESPETAKNHWVQLGFSGFPWFSLLKLPGVYRDSYRTNTICRFHYPNKTANHFKCVLLCCSQEFCHGTKKMESEHDFRHKKNMETAVPMIFSALTVSQKLFLRQGSIGSPRHLHLRKHPGSELPYTSRSIDLPTWLSIYPLVI